MISTLSLASCRKPAPQPESSVTVESPTSTIRTRVGCDGPRAATHTSDVSSTAMKENGNERTQMILSMKGTAWLPASAGRLREEIHRLTTAEAAFGPGMTRRDVIRTSLCVAVAANVQTIGVRVPSKAFDALAANPVLRNARAGVGSKSGGDHGAGDGISSRPSRHLSQPAAGHRRRAGRRCVVGSAAADGQVAVVQPAARRYRPAADRRLGRLRQRRALFRLPLRRSRAWPHQDLDHPPRQHLERRLGRPQPRRARHRPGVLPPDGQPERHPARHDQHARPATRTPRRTGCGRARPGRRQRATPSRSGCRCRRFASRAATTCRWGFCSGAASAASACRCRGRRSSRASGCSRSTPSSGSRTSSRGRPAR